MRIALLWSGGKDAALALCVLRERSDVVVERLVTMVDSDGRRSTVHDVPIELVATQADRLGLPLTIVPVSGDAIGTALYECGRELHARGFDAIATGDLRRSDAIEHRRATFWPAGLDVIAPLYALSSRAGIERCWRAGIEATVVVVDAAVLPSEAIGRRLDAEFVSELPRRADPAGELGEYHTFVTGGPGFTTPIELDLDLPERIVRTVGTTEGRVDYAYWVARPRVTTEVAASRRR